MDLITLAIAKKAAEQSGKSVPKISNATINENGELIFVFTDGTEINAGELPCYDNEEAIEELRQQLQAIPQSDWNQIDDTKLDFIKNKPKIATDDDILGLLTELGEITPAINSEGSIYTDNQNRIILI